MNRNRLASIGIALLLFAAAGELRPLRRDDGSVLPFPPTPSASVAGETLQQSKHQRRVEPSHLPKDAPNILIILLDDVGFGLPDTFGGVVHTPTLSRLADEGISYNAFHTTSICSPTRAALLTGRNHQRVGNGTIAERAVDWDGYTGVIPKTSATIAEVLRDYGYKTAAIGKWHNTPADQTTAMGPFDRWPTGHGFDYFYGFLAGETSQWEPRLYENLNPVEPPHDETYHLSEDLADKAITWMKHHQAFAPDKPFLLYWAPGAGHGPHHIFKEWADKYKGKFDDGWDAMRERIFARQKAARLDSGERRAHAAGRDDGGLGQHPRGGASVPAAPDGGLRRLRRARRRAGRQASSTSSTRSASATTRSSSTSSATTARAPKDRTARISELLAQNQIPNTIEQQLAGARRARWARRARRPEIDNMYHAGWAWAGDTPFRTPSSSPRTSAARATRWSSRGRSASSRTRRRARSSTTSTTSRRRSTRSSASSRRRW